MSNSPFVYLFRKGTGRVHVIQDDMSQIFKRTILDGYNCLMR